MERSGEKAGIIPPELSAVTRPLAVPSPQNCGGTTSTDLPPSRPTDVAGEARRTNCPSMTGSTVEHDTAVARASAGATSTSCPKFLIAPDLRAVFAEVGATDKAYSVKEILGFLKTYLYSNRHLFDSKDIHYVNCQYDRLGNALQVDRFHYTEVRGLIGRHVIPVENISNQEHAAGSHVPTSGTSYSGASAVSLNGCDSVTGESSFASSSNQTSHREPGRQSTYPYASIPGSSRQSTHFIEIPFPDVPDSDPDSESVYSYQGYETALCRNTEFEDSDVPEEVEFEEYELASDDDEGQEGEHSDDSDPVIEDVKVAVQALCDNEIEEEFWADDDSDTDEQSADEDPELAHGKWACLSCGIKNRPFVRYCGKCWQLRKNCLPERPKKKRRKPRPKKKLRRRCDSPVSEVNVTDCKESANCEELGQANILARSSSTASEQEASDLVRTSSIDQDSGISLSQYTYISSSQCTENEPSCSKTSDVERSSSRLLSPTIEEEPEKSSVIVESSERKRKLSSLKEDIHVKISKGHSSDFEDKMCEFEDEVSEIEMKLITDTAKFINSKGSGLASVDSDKLTVSEPAGEESHMCMLCCLRPKNAVIIHGRLSHQATCYQCARRLLNSGARCPVCRRKIHMVCKNIVV